jgi:hypothetical protein
MNDALRALVADADVSGWTGLPELSTEATAAAFRVDLLGARLRTGELGDPPRHGRWIAAPTRRFAGGLRLWLDPDDLEARRVVLVQALAPQGDDGWLAAPDLGEPGLLLPAVLGPLVLDDGERVYPERGLAVRANPANGVLLELIVFAPTTAEDYRTRLRPALPVETPLPERQGGAA